MKKILKCHGHCTDGCQLIDCDYWVTETRQNGRYEGITSKCELWPNADKNGSRSLTACDKVYGRDYEGPA